MNISVDLITLVIASYLIGSISCAIVFAAWMQLPDPRQLGSGNPGATNMLRTGSKKAAALTLAGDLLKSLLPLMVAKYLGTNEINLCWMGGAAILGHMYPIYYRFRGGKGVATTLGVLLAIHWPLAIIWSAVWLIMAKISRYSSLSALTATALLPLVAWAIDLPVHVMSLLVMISILVFWRHRTNISKLVQGQESRIGGSK